MRRLPLFPGSLRSAVEREAPLSYDPVCVRCPRGLQGQSTCLQPTGTGPGGVVVVVDGVTNEEDRAGRQGVSVSARMVASRVHRMAGGRPFIMDAAMKCAGRDATPEHVAACRPYLWRTLLDAKPERIIVSGQDAARAVLGRSPMLSSVRRGYGWIWDAPWAPPVMLADGRTVRPVPVFMVMPQWLAASNAFFRDQVDSDIAWACSASPHLPPWDGFTEVVETAADAAYAATVLGAARLVTFDVETSGRMHAGEIRVVSLAFSTDDGRSFVWDAAALASPPCFEAAAGLLEDDTVRKVAQNAKFDIQAIENGMGVTVRGLYGDTRIWRRMYNSGSLADLDTMAELVGMGGASAEMNARVDELVVEERKKAQVTKRDLFKAKPWLGDSLKGQKNQVEVLLAKHSDRLPPDVLRQLWRGHEPRAYVYGDVERDLLSRYNAADCVTTARLAVMHEKLLRDGDLMFTWESLWGPATEALAWVERWGFPVDRQRIELLSAHFQGQLNMLMQRFSVYPNFNPNSPDDVQELLYKTLKLRPPKTSEKTGAPSADKDALAQLKGQHPVIDDLLEWRHIAKLKSQYADGMILHIAPDGRIHTTYNVDGATSGRTSSENPNMQNIPSEERDPQDSKLVKDCFIARPGFRLLAADYAQLEFRIAADLAEDPDMRAVFESGEDFHTATAKFIAPIVWGIPGTQITKAHRRGAKSFNFGIMYGMQDSGIAERAGCTIAEAKQIRNAVLGKFRKFAGWIQECLAFTRKTGTAPTFWMGRRAHVRQLPLVKDENQGRRINAENSSFNTPVQGTASFYCLASVTAMVAWILRERLDDRVRLVATVHDSIVLEVREDMLLEVARKLRTVMCGWPTKTCVPLEVDMKVGQQWGSMTTYQTPEATAAAILGGASAARDVMIGQLSQEGANQ